MIIQYFYPKVKRSTTKLFFYYPLVLAPVLVIPVILGIALWGKKTLERTSSMIKAENLSLTYGNKLGISDISFQIDSGEIVSFVGPNGSGKTTLFRIMAGAIQEYTGCFYIDDLTIDNDQIRNGIRWLDETAYIIY